MAGGKKVNFGLGLRARDPSILQPYARDAQASGFDHIWVYDSPRFAEPYIAMSYCALAAPGLSVGTAVTNPVTRDPAVIANGFATLAALTGGRVKLGIGLGDSAVKFLGQKPATFEDFARKVRVIRKLLDGQEIEYNGKQLKLPVPPAKRLPVIMAAEGPKTFDFAGAECDGAIISPGGSPHFLRYAIEKIRAGASRVGRDPNELHICAWTHCVVAETRKQAVVELLPQVSRTLFKGAVRVPHEVLGFSEPLISAEMKKRVLDAVGHQSMEYELADELFAVLGDKLMQELTVVGTPDEVESKVKELVEVEGVSQLIINFHAKDPKLSFDTFRDRIIPAHCH
ncbi:MAG: LLM class flavin-dependent oxidoreductase [Betaproteobacteria bacterium]|nr:LLM class flavin-dependent oxidoreductase [Betaproteobacteria bacterium]